jgi:hypothetical protein
MTGIHFWSSILSQFSGNRTFSTATDAIANFARDRNLPNFSSRNRLQNIRNLGSSARMSRVGTKFDPPEGGRFRIVDVNVLYHSLIRLASRNGSWMSLVRDADYSATRLEIICR